MDQLVRCHRSGHFGSDLSLDNCAHDELRHAKNLNGFCITFVGVCKGWFFGNVFWVRLGNTKGEIQLKIFRDEPFGVLAFILIYRQVH